MIGPEAMAAVGFIIMILGFAFGIWKYVDAKLTSLRTESSNKIDATAGLAAMARSDLAAHKLHVAETYVTKAGMQEQTSALMKAIDGVGTRVETRLDGLNDRLDRMYESKPSARRS